MSQKSKLEDAFFAGRKKRMSEIPGVRRLPIPDRFWAYVSIGEPHECWNWKGSIDRKGYGRFRMPTVSGQVTLKPHRFSYELFSAAQIPKGMTIDHRCENERCVNPAHLRIAGNKENILASSTHPAAINARKTHCLNGHELTPDNVMRQSGGGRTCRKCNRKYQREWSAKKRERMRAAR